MAKAKHGSKSSKVREYKAAHPEATAADISKTLKVPYQTTYQALANGSKKKSSKKGRKAKAPAAMHGALDTAFDFVQQVGGLIHAEKLIDKLKAFKERL